LSEASADVGAIGLTLEPLVGDFALKVWDFLGIPISVVFSVLHSHANIEWCAKKRSKLLPRDIMRETRAPDSQFCPRRLMSSCPDSRPNGGASNVETASLPQTITP